ncbi:unnamed protein product, partial [Polarella glacialis]
GSGQPWSSPEQHSVQQLPFTEAQADPQAEAAAAVAKAAGAQAAVTDAMDAMDPGDPRNVPGPNWPASSPEESQRAWPAGQQPRSLAAWPVQKGVMQRCWQTE